MENQPLAPWQIEHIRKMQADLGTPDTEEVTMDEGTRNEDPQGGLPPLANAVDETGGLSVYSDPNVQRAVAERNKLNSEYKKYYDDLTAKITAQRTGPSFSERMYQLSAALFAPTSVRGFSGTMGNVLPVLQKQQQVQREGEIKRQDALSALQAAQLGQRAGLANQDVTTALAMAQLAKQGTGSQVTYAPDRGGFVPKPGVGGAPPMPEMDDYGNYVITNPRQLVYLPANTPIVLPGGDPTKPKYTRAGTTR